MWPYSWTHVGTPSHLGHMDRVAATMPSQAHAGAAQEAPYIGQWEGQDVPLVRPSSCNVKGGIPSSRRYLPTYLRFNSFPRKKYATSSKHTRGLTTNSPLPTFTTLASFTISTLNFKIWFTNFTSHSPTSSSSKVSIRVCSEKSTPQGLYKGTPFRSHRRHSSMRFDASCLSWYRAHTASNAASAHGLPPYSFAQFW